jgi:hypothetical protein
MILMDSVTTTRNHLVDEFLSDRLLDGCKREVAESGPLMSAGRIRIGAVLPVVERGRCHFTLLHDAQPSLRLLPNAVPRTDATASECLLLSAPLAAMISLALRSRAGAVEAPDQIWTDFSRIRFLLLARFIHQGRAVHHLPLMLIQPVCPRRRLMLFPRLRRFSGVADHYQTEYRPVMSFCQGLYYEGRGTKWGLVVSGCRI